LYFTGIYSFIDAFTTRRKTAQEYARMAQRGVRRVYVGLETGDAELLRFLGKPNTPGDVSELVQQLKAGGINVGLILLVGAGGERYAAAHAENTASLVSRLPLDSGDVIYLSELIDVPGSTYSALARDAGISPLSPEETDRRMAELRAALRAGSPGPVVSNYDIREFMY